MKISKNLIQGLLLIILFGASNGLFTVNTESAEGVKKQKRSRQSKVLKKTTNLAITVQDAREEIVNYIQHLDTKYNMQLLDKEKQGLATTATHMVYLKTGSEEPATPIKVSDLYKIKKSLKGHLRMFHPEKFVTQKNKRTQKIASYELPRKIAKRTIRETIKDHLVNTCGITDPKEVRAMWKLVKPSVDKKLDIASYRSEYDELIVPQKIVGQAIQMAYNQLARRGIVSQKKANQQKKLTQPKKQDAQTVKPPQSRRRSRQPSRPYRSRKEIERRIPIAQAKNMVINRLAQEELSNQERAFLQSKIMNLIKQTAKKGLVLPSYVQQITRDEIIQLKTLQNKLLPVEQKKRNRSKQFVHYSNDEHDEIEA